MCALTERVGTLSVKTLLYRNYIDSAIQQNAEWQKTVYPRGLSCFLPVGQLSRPSLFAAKCAIAQFCLLPAPVMTSNLLSEVNFIFRLFFSVPAGKAYECSYSFPSEATG